MKYEYVEEIRKVLVDELKDYEGEPVLLDIDESVLSQVIFNNYGDVKIFAPEVYSILNKINFSNVCFDNVCVSEVNFSNCVGVKLHPQTIANQDLRRSTLSGVEIIGPFDGVNIAYTNFKGSKGAIINPQTVLGKNFKGTILTDTKIIDSFDGCVLNETNFTGSACAGIDPQTVFEKSLNGCILDSATIVNGNFDSVNIEKCNFNGAKGQIKINPQTIYNKSLLGTVLGGVEFIGGFHGVELKQTDFTGSKGAIINPQTVGGKLLRHCIFNGVEFNGSFDDCVILYSNFTGSKGAIIDQTKLRQAPIREISISKLYGCNLRDAYVADNLTEKDRLYAKVDGAHMISVKRDEEKEQKDYCIRKIRSIVRKNNNSMNK